MERASVEAKYLSGGSFKKQAEALTSTYHRFHEAVTVLLLYQAKIESKLAFLGTFSANYSTQISNFKAAFTLVSSTQSSIDFSCKKA